MPGAAVFVTAARAACPAPPDGATIEEQAATASVVVLGIVSGPDDVAGGGRSFSLRPEVFLKGAATARPQVFTLTAQDSGCEVARLEHGARALVFAHGSNPFLGVFVEHPDGWRSAHPALSVSYTEAQLLDRIRAVTGQLAIPATETGDGAGIDWLTTVLPIGGVLLGLMAVGLVLMRIWHRIDPS
jgi:hypothetical protein